MSHHRSTRRAVPLWMLACLGGCCWLSPNSARAFEDVEVFADATAQGGGGKRYFTGSPADPYTCKVCHEHGEPPATQVSGLPLSGYIPGQAYEITLDWSDTLEHVAAAAEITDMQGHRAGNVRLPGQAELKDPELCEDRPRRAAQLLKVASDAEPEACDDDAAASSDCRMVVHSTSCGAQRLRFLWTAPERNVGPLWFAGAVVAADGDGTVLADGVSELGSVIASGSNARELEVRSGCSVAPARSTSRPWLLLLAAAVGCYTVGRRRRRNRAPASTVRKSDASARLYTVSQVSR